MTHSLGKAGRAALAWARRKAKLPGLPGARNTCRGKLDVGEALEARTRREMEAALGYDLSDVRIHVTKQASELVRKLGAEAVAIGGDIFAPESKLSTTTREGKGLLAHELIHVIQQTRPQAAFPAPEDSEPGPPLKIDHSDSSLVMMPRSVSSNNLGNSERQRMEAVAEMVEQSARIGDARQQDRGVPIDAEEIADRVYRLMQQELLVETERKRR